MTIQVQRVIYCFSEFSGTNLYFEWKYKKKKICHQISFTLDFDPCSPNLETCWMVLLAYRTLPRQVLDIRWRNVGNEVRVVWFHCLESRTRSVNLSPHWFPRVSVCNLVWPYMALWLNCIFAKIVIKPQKWGTYCLDVIYSLWPIFFKIVYPFQKWRKLVLGKKLLKIMSSFYLLRKEL